MPVFGCFHSLNTWYLNGPLLGTESLRPRTRQPKKKQEKIKRNEEGPRVTGERRHGEAGAKGPFNAACNFNYACYSSCCCCFFLSYGCFMCLWVLYMGRFHKGSRADKGFVIFFPPPDLLYPVDIVPRILLKQPSTETHHSGEEWGVCSPSSQCEAEPITRHNARFWETLGWF